MAKSIKKRKAKSITRSIKKVKRLSRSALVSTTSGVVTAADIGVVFKSGLGQITATLFRNGLLINMQSISTSGNIHFSDVQRGDSISINGICSGTADITVTVPTNPPTPEHFNAGIILTGYSVLDNKN